MADDNSGWMGGNGLINQAQQPRGIDQAATDFFQRNMGRAPTPQELQWWQENKNKFTYTQGLGEGEFKTNLDEQALQNVLTQSVKDSGQAAYYRPESRAGNWVAYNTDVGNQTLTPTKMVGKNQIQSAPQGMEDWAANILNADDADPIKRKLFEEGMIPIGGGKYMTNIDPTKPDWNRANWQEWKPKNDLGEVLIPGIIGGMAIGPMAGTLGGGITGNAAAGAILGGATSGATGKNPLQGALMGGLGGAVLGGFNSDFAKDIIPNEIGRKVISGAVSSAAKGGNPIAGAVGGGLGGLVDSTIGDNIFGSAAKGIGGGLINSAFSDSPSSKPSSQAVPDFSSLSPEQQASLYQYYLQQQGKA